MINKQNLWFITLFSLILILGIYYVSSPNTVLETFSGNGEDLSSSIEVQNNDVLVALKIESEEEILAQMEEARSVLLDQSATVAAKNEAYEKLQVLNTQKGKTEEIEKKIKEKFNLDSCAKIDGNKISITVSGKDEGTTLANNIIKEVQALYDTNMYITVKFQG